MDDTKIRRQGAALLAAGEWDGRTTVTIPCPSCVGSGDGPSNTTTVPYGSTVARFTEIDPCPDCEGDGTVQVSSDDFETITKEGTRP